MYRIEKEVTERMFNALEVNVCHDLYEKSDAFFQSSANKFFAAVSLGLVSMLVQRLP